MDSGKLRYGRAVINTYDHIDNRIAREVACHVAVRACDAVGGLNTEDTMSVFRVAHVQVWRQERLMKYVLESQWDTEKESKYKGYLISRGMAVQDAEDVIQTATLSAIIKFHEWEPWKSSFWTWLGWLAKRGIREKFDEAATVSIEDGVAQLELFPTMTYIDRPLANQDPASDTIDMAVQRLRDRAFSFYGEAADLIEMARSMGDDFKGFSSASFQDATGMTHTRILSKLKKADTRQIVSKCVRVVYGKADMVPPLELPNAESDVSLVR